MLAGILGTARDAEVVEERWQKLLADEDSDTLDEATRQHLAHDMGEAYRKAHRRVVSALDSDRYLELLESLDRLLADPPVANEDDEQDEQDEERPQNQDSAADGTAAEPEQSSSDEDPKAEEPKGGEKKSVAAKDEPQDMETVMVAHLEKAYKKLRKRHEKAVSNWDNDELSLHEREDYFHDMRKAAKKLRYAAEAAGSATSLKTKRLYKACKKMQSVLGDFQDSVTSRDKLLKVAATARRRGEDTFGYGLLYQRERAIGLAALDDYSEAAKDIKSAFKALKKKMK